MRTLSLDQLQKGFLQDLMQGSVRFIVVGGVAVNFHGHQRSTKDLDILSEPTSGNAARLAQAICKLGFKNNKFLDLHDLTEVLSKPNTQQPLWGSGPGEFVHIEILTRIDGVSFAEAYKQAVMHDEAGLRVPILSKSHLIRSKETLAQGDEKHRADVRALTASK